jgi:hypothetical protein
MFLPSARARVPATFCQLEDAGRYIETVRGVGYRFVGFEAAGQGMCLAVTLPRP